MKEFSRNVQDNLLSFKEEIIVPDDLEVKLRSALYGNESKKPHPYRFKAVAAVITAFILLNAIYYSPVLAYQVKKILGYENVMNASLADLNKQGKGQPLNVTYNDPQTGIQITLDGVMLDQTQMILFYTLKGTDQYPVSDLSISFPYLNYGIFGQTAYSSSGRGEINEAANEIKWISNFEAPKTLSRKMTFHFSLTYYNGSKTINIASPLLTFNLDRSTAQGSTINQQLSIPVTIGDTNLTLNKIIAAPTQTVIEMSGQDAGGLFEALGSSHYASNDIQLIVNGKTYQGTGGGEGRNQQEIHYSLSFPPITEKVQTIQLKFNKFKSSDKVNIPVKLLNEKQTISFNYNNQAIPLKILDIQSNNNAVEVLVNIDNKSLAGIADATLQSGNISTNLGDSREENLSKTEEGISYTQVLFFPKAAISDNITLTITRACLVKTGPTVDIPIK